MKFGKNLREKTLKEWRFYAVDYKALKKTIKKDDSEQFFRLLRESEVKLSRFYHDRESWAFDYMQILLERVQALREAMDSQQDAPTESESSSSESSVAFSEEDNASVGSSVEIDRSFTKLCVKAQSFGTKQAWLKEEYRRMGSSKQFKSFIYAKKSLATFDRELGLLIEFLDLNNTAFSKILKKFDKCTGSAMREEKMAGIL